MLFKAACLALLAATLALALTAPAGHTRKAHPCTRDNSCKVQDYARVSRSDAAREHTVTLWTTQKGFDADQCGSLLMDVSDPDSPKYGKHLSFAQIKDLVHDQAALDAIHAFLDKNGVAQEKRFTAPNGEFVEVKAPIATIEAMFSAEFHAFHSATKKATIQRSFSHVIPAELAAHVSLVAGISDFPMYHRKTVVQSFGDAPQAGPKAGGMYPALIVQTYRLPNETDATPKADMGVFEALGQSYSDDDLAAFQKQYKLPRQKIAKIIGPNDGSSCKSNPDNCVEATLDVEYIMAMAQGAPMTYWSIADQDGDIFLEFIKAVAKAQSAPQVFSISYGGPEHLQDASSMQQFSLQVCKMGLRGMTIFVASGDDGVAGYEARSDKSQCGFKPAYPANVPYVTSVGATMGPESGQPEVACQSNKGSIITTGGGFSDFYAMPAYQTQAVATYFSTVSQLPPKGLYNTTGRGYPDVSSLGNDYNVFIGGQMYQVSGTSAASPVFCAMVTLVNGDRQTRGKGPLGFLNPILYKVDKSVFNDIVDGENNCCAGQSPVCCKYGFFATKGWDPLTGWGSLDFPLFAAALSNL